MDFTQWIRQDFLDFDKRRQEVMQPTQEEILQQEEEQKKLFQDRIDSVKNHLSIYGISFIGTETDFRELYTKYLMGDGIELSEEEKENGTTRNYKFSDGFGTDEQINGYIDKFSEEWNTLPQFSDFILANENNK